MRINRISVRLYVSIIQFCPYSELGSRAAKGLANMAIFVIGELCTDKIRDGKGQNPTLDIAVL